MLGPDGSVVTVERVKQFRQSRFSPIRSLTPESLSRQLDDFAAGYVRQFALTMDAIERRDDILQNVAPKRKKAVARRSWSIEVQPGLEENAEAKAHKEALEFFYNHLRVTDAVDMNRRGGVRLMIRQMMDAVGRKYAVHEILWAPTPKGLSATLKYVPLWFFENHTGNLRFLAQDAAYDGVPLEEGAWMVHMGDGVMEACAVAYMFKHLPLKDWLIYCEKHGMPGVHGKTSAPKGSEQWNAMIDAVAAIARDFSVVTSEGDKIEKIDLTTEGELPYPKLVERMDRALASLWRGADLSTISAGDGQGQGASLQGEEALILENDDCVDVSETCNEYLDRRVIEYTFGFGVEPLASFRIAESRDDKSAIEFKRKVFLQWLADGTVGDILANATMLGPLVEELGLPRNKDYEDPYVGVTDDHGRQITGEVVLDKEGDIIGAQVDESTRVQQAPNPNDPNAQPDKARANAFANEGTTDVDPTLFETALAQGLGVRPKWLAPIRTVLSRLEAALQNPETTDEEVLKLYEQAVAQLPELLGKMDIHSFADTLEAAIGAAAVEGLRSHIREEAK